ncbi:major facilitator superfamily domain-containing protein [Phlebopus sp. FC_14]|nr:major facilitator superfamily domain-containing protein [Phlebopus sp. FC_14]
MPPSLSPCETLANDTRKTLPLARKLVLLIMFCMAQFLEAFNTAALFSAIPALGVSMHITESESVWVFSAFQLTFASFLLISGRISDVYNPKIAFIGGLFAVGLISVGAGFVNNKIAIIVLRALIGIATAMTIPSALTLIVKVFPDPLEQARAIGVFGGCAAVANVLGLLISAIFVQWTSFHWVFWFVGIVSIPVASTCFVVIPHDIGKVSSNVEPRSGAKWKSLDLIGVAILTVAVILFIFAVTSGSTYGWGTAEVIVPLIISILLMVGFFYWETLLPVENAAIPPRTWFYTNFSVLFGLALFPFFWWNAVFTIFTTLWQNVFHWSVISTAVHMLPLGVLAFAISFTGSLSRVFSPKWLMLTGLTLLVIATMLLAVGGGSPDHYWPFVFPGFVLGSAGAMLTYTHTNIAIFQAAPASMAGTVGAIFNGALQFGSAIGLAAVSSIETSVEATHGGPTEYQGRSASFWFVLGIVCLEIISISCFYQTKTDHQPRAKFDDRLYNGSGMSSKERADELYDTPIDTETSSPV